MKRFATFVVIGILSVSFQAGCKSTTPGELLNSIEITDVETKWVSKYYQPWPPRLILVPQISFRVKNIGDKPLDYINFNAVFKFKGDMGNFGDAFLAAIRKEAVPAGEKSDIIVLKSNLGVDGKNLQNIVENPEWRPTEANLFALSRGSLPVLLGVYDISREIDFKEPEAVEPVKKEEIR